MLRTVLLIALLAAAGSGNATEAGWAQLREGGRVVLLTHAQAPGSPEMRELDDKDFANCRTQRNLSERGRQQARRMGPLFLARAAPTDQVLSSRLCRTYETARIAFGGDPEPFEALDPLPQDETTAQRQIAAIIELIEDYRGWGNLVLVTHPGLVQALTGIAPREAEAIIVVPRDNSLHVTGRIVFN